MKLLNECYHLNSLTRLTFYSCSFPHDPTIFQLIVNNIWSLPKPIHFYFGIVIREQQFFCMPTIISSSLECVTISMSELKWNEISRLLMIITYHLHFQHLPELIFVF